METQVQIEELPDVLLAEPPTSLVGMLSPDEAAEFWQWVREEWEYDSSAPLSTEELCVMWLLDNWERVVLIPY